jgi:hypothetical protein
MFKTFQMSWQAYVDQQMMDKKLKKAAIAGFDGNIWAKVCYVLHGISFEVVGGRGGGVNYLFRWFHMIDWKKYRTATFFLFNVLI